MKTVNSLSGGKTSSYLAVHYSADYDIFSLVCIDDNRCKPKDDLLIKKVNDKLQKYCSHLPEFIATIEDDKILKVMFDLEQKIGREITWVRGDSFDAMIEKKSALPNKAWRFCTTWTKIEPIFWWWYLNLNEKIQMNVGFRYDEKERKDSFTTSYRIPTLTKNYGENRQEWTEFEWRVGGFPMIEDRITSFQVKEYWDSQNIDFAKDSNCLHCFWKDVQILRRNWDRHPEKMNWAMEQEINRKATFKTEASIAEIKNVMIQTSFFDEDTDAGCSSGVCMA